MYAKQVSKIGKTGYSSLNCTYFKLEKVDTAIVSHSGLTGLTTSKLIVKPQHTLVNT